ncbi:MAG: helix-turn-helix domain-containing protein, partial [Pseudohongiella sp.]|nr:helix-turn-helix domain-containing protein [Pseudohongiella sp.]
MEKLERHEEILDAAERVFFQKNYEQSTMDDIAREAHL